MLLMQIAWVLAHLSCADMWKLIQTFRLSHTPDLPVKFLGSPLVHCLSQPGLLAEPLVLPVCLSLRSQLLLTVLLGVGSSSSHLTSGTPLAVKLWGSQPGHPVAPPTNFVGTWKKWKQSQEDLHRTYCFYSEFSVSLITPLVNFQSP